MNHPNMNMFDRVYVHTYFKIHPQISKVPLHIYQISTIILLFDTTHLSFPIMDNHRSALHQVTLVVVQLSPHSREGVHSINEAIENQTKWSTTNTWFLDSVLLRTGKKLISYDYLYWFAYTTLYYGDCCLCKILSCQHHVNQLWYNGMK